MSAKLTKTELISLGILQRETKIKKQQPIGKEFRKIWKIVSLLNRIHGKKENKTHEGVTFWGFMPYEGNSLKKWYIVTESIPFSFSEKLEPFKRLLGKRVIFCSTYDQRVRTILDESNGLII